MKRANFVLEHLYYPNCTVKANYNYKRDYTETEAQDPQSKIFIAPRDQSHAIHMSMQLIIPSESPADPYEIDLLVIGHFSGDPASVSEKDFVNLAVTSGPNLLYGAARERIMAMTSLSAWGGYIIPAIVFEPEDFISPDDPDPEAES